MKNLLALMICFPLFAMASTNEISCVGAADDLGIQTKTVLSNLTSSSVLVSFSWISNGKEGQLMSNAKLDVYEIRGLFTITGAVTDPADGNLKQLPEMSYDSNRHTLVFADGPNAGQIIACR